MSFNVTGELINEVAKITLSGDLDANAAPEFRTAVEGLAVQNPRRLALVMTDLDYMASAGLRVLVFARQKMGTDVDIYVIGAHGIVMDTIQMTGFQYSVYLLDTYDPATVERF
jgi:anti-anti-sigma factor